MPPREFGKWQTAYGFFNNSSKTGVWREIMEKLTRKERRRRGRKAELSAGSADSRSVKTVWNWVGGLKKTHKVDLEVVEKQGKGFHVVKRRWVVERTFSWLLNFRQNARDFEKMPHKSEAMLQISLTQTLLKRLAWLGF